MLVFTSSLLSPADGVHGADGEGGGKGRGEGREKRPGHCECCALKFEDLHQVSHTHIHMSSVMVGTLK